MSGPAAWLWLGLAVPVVWAYLRRAPLPRREVPSALPFRALPTARPVRRRRPEEWASLLLVLGALGVGVAALALRPPAGRHVVVLVDDSASMGLGSRWEAVIAAVDRWVEASPDDAVTLLATAPPRVLRSRARDPGGVRAAVAGLSPGGTGGDVEALARAACADDGAVLLVLSDVVDGEGWGCDEGIAPPVGPADGRAVVTAAALRRTDALDGVSLEIGAAGGSETASVSLAVDDVPLASAEVPLREGVGHRRLTREIPAGDRLTVRTEQGGIELVLPSPRPVRVVLMTDAPDGYTALALRAHPGVSLEVVHPTEAVGGPVDLLLVEAVPEVALPDARRRVALGVDPRALGLPTAHRLRGPSDLRAVHEALLWQVDLSGLAISEAWVWPEEVGDPVIRASGGLLATIVDGPEGRWTAVGVSPAATDWPLRIGFVHFLANLVDAARPDAGVASAVGLPVQEVRAQARSGGDALPASWFSWQRAALVGGLLLLLEALIGLRRRRR